MAEPLRPDVLIFFQFSQSDRAGILFKVILDRSSKSHKNKT